MRALRVFLASFLVLFIEIALIRWMPAYIRLLAYFSNFILLAAFLGIGVGSLLASIRTRLFAWFPLVLFALVAVVYFFRLEVTVQTSGDIFFSSGTPQKVVTVESTYLLPVLFIIVAALFTALAQRMAAEMSTLPPLEAYTINILGSLAGVVAFAVMSWREAPPQYWWCPAWSSITSSASTPSGVERGSRAASWSQVSNGPEPASLSAATSAGKRWSSAPVWPLWPRAPPCPSWCGSACSVELRG